MPVVVHALERDEPTCCPERNTSGYRVIVIDSKIVSCDCETLKVIGEVRSISRLRRQNPDEDQVGHFCLRASQDYRYEEARLIF